jgi:cyclophilin family peptidyl-prolyl cis-trans isomerase
MNNQPKIRLAGLILATGLLSAGIYFYFYPPKIVQLITQRLFGGSDQSLSNDSLNDLNSENNTKNNPEGNSDMSEATNGNTKINLAQALEVGANGLSKAVVVIATARGKMKYRFYTNDAPKTAARIAELIQTGFYNGLTFHRVVPGFVVQGGDPTGTGAGGSGTKLKAEFNARKHVAGAVAMARSQSPDSADSQFYITLGTHPHLDNQYTVFGQIIEGQEVASQLQQGDRMTSVTIEVE